MKLKEKMANAKAYVQKNQKKFVLMMCSIVLVGGIVAGTLAWLAARTDPVINNFIGSDLIINISEIKDENFQMIPGKFIHKDPMITVQSNSEACWLFLQIKESPAQANGSGMTKIQKGSSVDRTTRGDDSYKYLYYEVLTGTDEFEDWILMTPEQVTAATFPATDTDGSVNTYYYRKVGLDGTAIVGNEEIHVLKELEDNDPEKTPHVQVNTYIINDELNDLSDEGWLSQHPVTITFTPIAIQRLGFESIDSAGKQIAGKFKEISAN